MAAILSNPQRGRYGRASDSGLGAVARGGAGWRSRGGSGRPTGTERGRDAGRGGAILGVANRVPHVGAV